MPIFAIDKYDYCMKDNRYPEYEDNTRICCESSPTQAAITTHSRNGVVAVHDEIDDLDWNRFPTLGPSSDEEAIERIALFEDKYSKGQVNWTSSEEFDKQLLEDVVDIWDVRRNPKVLTNRV